MKETDSTTPADQEGQKPQHKEEEKAPRKSDKEQVLAVSQKENVSNKEERSSSSDDDDNKLLAQQLTKLIPHLQERFERNPERRMTFFDAAIAIALTILILPLMDSATELYREQGGEGEEDSITLQSWLRDNVGMFLTFLLSFAVIVNEWDDHSRLMQNMKALTRRMKRLLWIWLLLIVLLPLSTVLNLAKVDETTSLALQHAIYIGNILLIKVMNIIFVLLIRCNMDKVYKDDCEDITPRFLAAMGIEAVILAFAIPL
ncbi:MAG: hypothetical protein SGARI_006652, partial [Bacillariaceae sp.]